MFDFLLRKPVVTPMYPDELGGVVNYSERLDRANDGLGREVEGSAQVLKFFLSHEKHGSLKLENVEIRRPERTS